MSFQKLRNIMMLKPSPESFDMICNLLSEWEGDDLQLAIDYCHEHTASWKDEYCHAENLDWYQHQSFWDSFLRRTPKKEAPLPVWWPLVRFYYHDKIREYPKRWLDPFLWKNIKHLALSYDISWQEESFETTTKNFFFHIRNVDKLSLSRWKTLKELTCLSELENLKSLMIHGSHLTDISALKHLKKLRHLELIWCPFLQSLDGVEKVPFLQSLELRYCYGLRNIESLQSCKDLSSLSIKYCRGKQSPDEVSYIDVKSLASLHKLEYLELNGRDVFEIEPKKTEMTLQEEVISYQQEIDDFYRLQNK